MRASRILPVLGLLIAGIINLLPVPGVLGRAWLQSLYGFDVGMPDLEILLRHRAVLFGIVGILLLVSIFWVELRLLSAVIGVASMASFLIIAAIVGGYGQAIGRVVVADIVGVLALVPVFVWRKPVVVD